LVEANWNASALAAEAPLANSDLAIAIAAYEHEEDAAPSPVAKPIGFAPEPDRACSMRSRGTHACTIAEIVKPSTSAHHTSQAIRNEFLRPCQSTSRAPVMSGHSESWSSTDYTPSLYRYPRAPSGG